VGEGKETRKRNAWKKHTYGAGVADHRAGRRISPGFDHRENRRELKKRKLS